VEQGYGNVALQYPFELPRALASVGYTTTSLGKDHFGWEYVNSGSHAKKIVTLTRQLTAGRLSNQTSQGVAHGYQTMSLYDGITDEPDQYHQWFEASHGGEVPEAGWPTLDMNSWRGAPYVFDEQFHPTAWVGSQAVQFLSNYNHSAPFFLKVCSCRVVTNTTP
jgi:arylsulfatase